MSSGYDVTVEFSAKPTRPLSNKVAEEVGPEIHALMQKNEGDELTPHEYLDWVKANPNSKSYSQFEWEDTIAATKWRVHQARNIINSIEIKVIDDRGEAVRVPAFIHVMKANEDESSRQLYTSYENVLNDEESSSQVVARACRDFLSWRRRYLLLRGKLPLADIYDATDVLAQELEAPEED
tara:strand:+ start:391 stop:933 length:543 start_codon:yes stop_codon:yes gene_type:complete